MRRHMLSRRTMLRGMGGSGVVSLALPPLEAMLNSHGTAYAAAAFPRRFGVWFYGCGITAQSAALAVDNFFPKTPGPTWTPPPLLMPLAATKEYVTVVGGTQWTIAQNTPHHVSRTSQLSGSYNTGNAGNGGKAGAAADTLAPSIDRIVADAWKGQTAVDSVEMAVSRVGKYEGMISFKPGQIFPGEFNPANTFRRLFGNGIPQGMTAGTAPPAGAASASKALLARRSVLDTVIADVGELKMKLGKADVQRLEAHLSGLRDIEHQLDTLMMKGALPPPAMGAGCVMPVDPGVAAYNMSKEDFVGVHKAFADLLVTALACDLTRVFTLEFTGAQCNTLLTPVGVAKPFHDYSHGGGNPDVAVLAMAKFSLEQFGYLVDKLKATPQGAGNLLDSLCLYAVNEYLNGSSHNMLNGNHPILIVGKANGALRAGQFVKPATVENGSKVCVAMLHAVGVKVASFGVGAGIASEPLPGLLAA